MDSASREALAQRVLERSTADQTEVIVSSADRALTRFTHEVCNQNVAVTEVGVSIRAIVDGRTGVAQTNHLDDTALDDVVRRAIAMAKLAPKDPAQPGLPNGGPVEAPPGAYDGATAAATPEVRARMCDAIFREAEGAGYWSAGYVSTNAGGTTVLNSSGARASFDGTDAGVNVKMNAPDSTGFGEAYSAAVDNVDAGAAGNVAVTKARKGASPQSVDPGAWTVVFEPAAFGELVMYVAEHFSAQSFEEGSSFCSEGLNRRYFAENVNIRDDYAHPLNPGMPFDYEGQPTQRLALVENGIVRNVVTDSYYARKLDLPNTGHALPAPNSYGPQAMHLVVGAGTKPVEQLVAETKRGLLVTRTWYIRTVDQKRAIVTGMTRDGTFLIENGKVTSGVRNLRFNESLLEMLQHCEFGRDQHRSESYHYSVVTPAVKVAGFNFTSTTAF
ncbi:MAG: TldD/PmbA family protein [Candidatus Eremiobacteraeota bacterium]|nr:TldD/PmbA family protein [Candidatus Eremiobacteraeota bacterium]